MTFIRNSFLFFSVLFVSLSCTNILNQEMKFDIQGHRGTRGLMPENTIPAFLKAIDLGVTTLEMDLTVTKNHELLVSHDAYFSSDFCKTPDGEEIPDSLQESYNIYQMDYEEVRQFDCGSKVHPRFPEQEKFLVSKPLLRDVINEVDKYIKANDLAEIAYNIEVKSDESGDDLFHPKPNVYSDLVFKALDNKIPWSRITVQSFDFRILRYFHSHYPQVTLAVLIENKISIDQNLSTLGFTPSIYSCDYALLSRENVNQLHDKGIKVIPWTVNETHDMKKLIEWGVDGLITDYPDRYNQIKDE